MEAWRFYMQTGSLEILHADFRFRVLVVGFRIHCRDQKY
jgi:hypothetical protein